jgi:hypothetical protein
MKNSLQCGIYSTVPNTVWMLLHCNSSQNRIDSNNMALSMRCARMQADGIVHVRVHDLACLWLTCSSTRHSALMFVTKYYKSVSANNWTKKHWNPEMYIWAHTAICQWSMARGLAGMIRRTAFEMASRQVMPTCKYAAPPPHPTPPTHTAVKYLQHKSRPDDQINDPAWLCDSLSEFATSSPLMR